MDQLDKLAKGQKQLNNKLEDKFSEMYDTLTLEVADLVPDTRRKEKGHGESPIITDQTITTSSSKLTI
jgi:hypothetical protein